MLAGGIPISCLDKSKAGTFVVDGPEDELAVKFLVNCFVVYAYAVYGDLQADKLKQLIEDFKNHFKGLGNE